jgi:iron complex transport system permease protein
MRGVSAALGVFVVALFAASIAVGPTGFAPLSALSDALAGRDSPMALVLVELRLPRALLGAILGGALGLAGAAMQGLLRNPLAEPGVTGVTATAALGAVLTFYGGYASATPLALPLAGIAGAASGAILLLAIAGRDATVATVILIGAALNALAGAATALVLGLSPNPYAFYEIGTWLMGSIADRGLDHVALALPCVALGCLPLLAARRGLDALALGEETARGLGVDPRRLTWLVVSGAALAVGGAVAVSGVVGFVGLMAPHAIRPLVRHRPGASLVPSALAGAALVLIADITLRLLPTGRELPLGVMTALLGAPVLWQLAWRARRGGQTPWL